MLSARARWCEDDFDMAYEEFDQLIEYLRGGQSRELTHSDIGRLLDMGTATKGG